MKLIKLDDELLNYFCNHFTPIEHNEEVVLDHDEMFGLMINHLDKSFITTNNSYVDSKNELLLLWNRFILIYKDSYFKQLDVMNADYNPIENYNGTSTITHGKRVESGEVNGGERHNDTEVKDYNTAFNTETYSNDGKTNSVSNSATFKDTTTSTYEEYSDTEIKSGNLGVTSTQSMMVQELDVRRKIINKWLVDQFATDYLFYV